MILFFKTTVSIYLYSLKNDDTHIPNQQLCTIFVHSFFLYKRSSELSPNLRLRRQMQTEDETQRQRRCDGAKRRSVAIFDCTGAK